MVGASLELNLKHDFPAFISREFLLIIHPLAARYVARRFDQADHLEVRIHFLIYTGYLESRLTIECGEKYVLGRQQSRRKVVFIPALIS